MQQRKLTKAPGTAKRGIAKPVFRAGFALPDGVKSRPDDA
jgi:hypothetical protein